MGGPGEALRLRIGSRLDLLLVVLLPIALLALAILGGLYLFITGIGFLGNGRRLALPFGFSLGFEDILMGVGIFFSLAVLPALVLEDPRERRIVMLVGYLILGSLMFLMS